MSKIPTAEELYYNFKEGNVNISKKQFIEAVKYSNSLHVKAALEAAASKSFTVLSEATDSKLELVTKDSILNAYPENLIV